MAKAVVDSQWDVGGHSTVLADIITKRNVKKFAEIGVFRAHSAKYILYKCHNIIDEYWGIDKYDTRWNGVTYTHPKLDEHRWHEMYIRSCRFTPFYPQFKIMRMSSEEAAQLFPKRFFPDGYFDFVYIDADHTYDMVKNDIQLWLPIVKKGGLIGGHDYGFPDEICRYGGVQKAVDEMFEADRIVVYKKQGVWLVEV